MSDRPPWMIYGANGYTGSLVAREAVRRGERPVLAGRRQQAVENLAAELALRARVFDLSDERLIAEAVKDVSAVLHCAGPFVHTSAPMVDACLAMGTHYLDITGEIPVLERVMELDQRARHAGVALVPGVGFDVVPTDCLAASLSQALPEAVRLELAFTSEGGGLSPGTLKSMVESLPHLGAVRRGGRIVEVPPAYKTREIDFPVGRRLTVTIPWGDVSTAFHTTGIPDILIYTAARPGAVRRLRRLEPFLPLLALRPIKSLLQWWIGRRVTGPDEKTRRSARCYLWGAVWDEAGRSATGTAETPEGFAFTAVSSVECTVKVVTGQLAPGSWTPARAFGADLARELPGVELQCEAA